MKRVSLSAFPVLNGIYIYQYTYVTVCALKNTKKKKKKETVDEVIITYTRLRFFFFFLAVSIYCNEYNSHRSYIRTIRVIIVINIISACGSLTQKEPFFSTILYFIITTTHKYRLSNGIPRTSTLRRLYLFSADLRTIITSTDFYATNSNNRIIQQSANEKKNSLLRCVKIKIKYTVEIYIYSLHNTLRVPSYLHWILANFKYVHINIRLKMFKLQYVMNLLKLYLTTKIIKYPYPCPC